jgi:hypothetical protein
VIQAERTGKRLQLLAAIPECRHLRVSVRVPELDNDLIAWLARELMHAVELATARDVKDQPSLRRIYRRIGRAGRYGEEAESAAAQETWTKGLHEMRGSRRHSREGPFQSRCQSGNQEDHMWTLRGLALVLAVIVTACSETTTVTPIAPTLTQTQTTTPTDLSPFVGIWNLTLRLTDVKGDSGCVTETMKSQLGVPDNYWLTITPANVTITNPSGDYACTFDSLKTDSSSFTTYGVGGYFTCQNPTLAFRCSDGTMRDLFAVGQDIAARFSGTEVSGTWSAYFADGGGGVEVTAEFKGSR